jgi:hypothetical protein
LKRIIISFLFSAASSRRRRELAGAGFSGCLYLQIENISVMGHHIGERRIDRHSPKNEEMKYMSLYQDSN